MVRTEMTIHAISLKPCSAIAIFSYTNSMYVHTYVDTMNICATQMIIHNHITVFLHIFYIRSCYENNSTDALLVDKVSLSSSDSRVVGNDLGPEPTLVEDSCINLDATHLNVVENLSSVINIEIPVIMKNSEDDNNHETTNTSFTGNHASDPGNHVIIANSGEMVNTISDSSLLKDETSNLHHGNSQDENAQNVTPTPESCPRKKKMDSSGTTHSAWRFKLLLIFVACCIIGCYLIPFAVNTTQFTRNTNEDFSNDKNISNANVSYY